VRANSARQAAAARVIGQLLPGSATNGGRRQIWPAEVRGAVTALTGRPFVATR
jgi:hypothetical protein